MLTSQTANYTFDIELKSFDLSYAMALIDRATRRRQKANYIIFLFIIFYLYRHMLQSTSAQIVMAIHS